MAPWLAFGPSFIGAGAAKGLLELGSLIMSPSFCFFLGPGLPRGFGVPVPFAPSAVARLRFLGTGPLRLGPVVGGANADGVLVPFMTLVESVSAGVSAADSTIWGAGVGAGDELEADSAAVAAGSWGKAFNAAGDRRRTTTLDLPGLTADILTMHRLDDGQVAMGGEVASTRCGGEVGEVVLVVMGAESRRAGGVGRWPSFCVSCLRLQAFVV